MEEKLDLAPFDEWIKTLEVPEETYFFEFDNNGNVIALHPGFSVTEIKNKIQVDLDTALGIYERGETLSSYKIDLIKQVIFKKSKIETSGLRKIDDVLHRVIEKKWAPIGDSDISIVKNDNTLIFSTSSKYAGIIWEGETDLLFLITDYNDPNVLREMISFKFGDLLENPKVFSIETTTKFSIYTRRIFDKYTFEEL